MKILFPYYFKRKSRKAQALYEFIVSLFVLPLFIAIIITLTRIYVTQLRCLQAARHGAFLKATDRVSDADVRNEVKQFMRDSGFDDGSRLQVTVETTHYGVYQPFSKVTVKYRVKVFDLGAMSFWGSHGRHDYQCSETVVCGMKGIVGLH